MDDCCGIERREEHGSHETLKSFTDEGNTEAQLKNCLTLSRCEVILQHKSLAAHYFKSSAGQFSKITFTAQLNETGTVIISERHCQKSPDLA
jgi:hypothetical protein